MTNSTVLKIKQAKVDVSSSGSQAPPPLINDFTTEVASGDRVAIIGFNGSGKSTLLECLALRRSLTSGSINWRDEYFEPGGGGLYVPQGLGPLLMPWLSLKKHISIIRGAKLAPLLPETAFSTAEFMRSFEDRRVGLLSGGERQLCLLNLVLRLRWQACLLDEPFSALDNNRATSIILDIYELMSRFKDRALFLVLHRWDHALYLANKVWTLSSKSGDIKVIDNTYSGQESILRGELPTTLFQKLQESVA